MRTIAGLLPLCLSPHQAVSQDLALPQPIEAPETVHLRVERAGTGPLVVLLHGFPDLGVTWRRQRDALVAAGFRVVVPDLRGFGGSDVPEGIEAYDMRCLVADVLGLVDAEQARDAVVVGHDWGAAIAWRCAVHHPDRFPGVVALSVPYAGHGPLAPTERLRAASAGRFHYMLYFQEPGLAEQELEPRAATLLRRLYVTPGTQREAPCNSDPAAGSGGWLDRLGEPLEPCTWFTDDDVAHYQRAFERTGLGAALNYYRNLDRNWASLGRVEDPRVRVPALFLAGARDPLLRGRSAGDLRRTMSASVPDLRGVHLVEGGGHWVHLQLPRPVNVLLISFLDQLVEGEGTERRWKHATRSR